MQATIQKQCPSKTTFCNNLYVYFMQHSYAAKKSRTIQQTWFDVLPLDVEGLWPHKLFNRKNLKKNCL